MTELITSKELPNGCVAHVRWDLQWDLFQDGRFLTRLPSLESCERRALEPTLYVPA
jgi:hypothetical protein